MRSCRPVFKTGQTWRYFLSGLVLLLYCIFPNQKVYSQTITLSVKRELPQKLFREVEKQTAYRFIYAEADMKQAKPVTLQLKNAAIEEFLEACFAGQPFSFRREDFSIIVFAKTIQAVERTQEYKSEPVRGRILTESREPIAGATVRVKETGVGTATDQEGFFSIANGGIGKTLVISSIGFEGREVPLTSGWNGEILLVTSIGRLDETIVMAYGTTTRRLNTGNIGKVSGEEISKQPVSNPLAALQGRIAGLQVTQSSGVPGSSFTVQIRGRNSLAQGSEPLFIVDGVPFAAGNESINQLSNAASVSSLSAGLSPFNLLNPQDIESIEVLKDADATAIYGSRGANGVVLITTRKGKNGKTVIDFSAYTGWSRVTRTMDFLNTREYLEMRREAFVQDGIVPQVSTAPDLLLWDTTRYTDFKKLLIGHTARTGNMQLSLSGGTAATRFLIRGGYSRETTVMPTDQANSRLSIHSNINHQAWENRLVLSLTAGYSQSRSQLPVPDLAAYVNRAPNQRLYDSSGKLAWEEGGVSFRSGGLIDYANPLAMLQEKYEGVFRSLLSNMQVEVKAFKGLVLRANMGYNNMIGEEKRLSPSTSIDPYSNTLPSANFSKSLKQSWIMEPQAEYMVRIGPGKLLLLMGASWQENEGSGLIAEGTNYTSDLLLGSIAGAGLVKNRSSSTHYRYTAVFSRVNYNVKDRYILNLSGRRDGTSRFGQKDRFNNFGAAGVAWVFSSERGMKERLPFLSFGKLRGSYGITGNDQVGDFRFIDTWNVGSIAYQGVPSLQPLTLFNPELGWESNRKLEGAIDLGFFAERIQISAAWFRNRSGNQLVNYPLPAMTGFTFIAMNLPALVENSGWEFQIGGRPVIGSIFNWSTSLVLTLSKNKLVSFPDIEKSTYANQYIVGEPLSIMKVYDITGVNATTGLYDVVDQNADGKIDNSDRILLRDLDPRYYGGLQNNISYRKFRLDIFFEFKRQTGANFLRSLSVPGTAYRNQPVVVRDRWQKPGDVAMIQRYTSGSGSNIAYNLAANFLSSSDEAYSDASYIRLKNVNLSYTMPERWLGKGRVVRAFLEGQNLLTITGYKGSDPEIKNINVLSPLRTLAAGIQITF